MTRFAPAPTGFLHLGHVANAILVFGLARAFSGRVLLRIEDHDRGRGRPEFEASIHEDLHWLGFDDFFATSRQSDRGDVHASALERLHAKGLVYACSCSRKTIEALGGGIEGEVRYPGTCRDTEVDGALNPARRVRIEETRITFNDLRLNEREQIPALQCGDVLVRDRLGQWTYQFAVVVDDFDQGVDLVVRGEDLLESTGRQIQIATLLGRGAPPRFLHHPLLTTPDGRKLSKSSRDTGVRDLRALGWSAAKILGAAGAGLGISNGENLLQEDLAPRVFASANA